MGGGGHDSAALLRNANGGLGSAHFCGNMGGEGMIPQLRCTMEGTAAIGRSTG